MIVQILRHVNIDSVHTRSISVGSKRPNLPPDQGPDPPDQAELNQPVIYSESAHMEMPNGIRSMQIRMAILDQTQRIFFVYIPYKDYELNPC